MKRALLNIAGLIAVVIFLAGAISAAMALSTNGALPTSITVTADLTPLVAAVSPNASFNTNVTPITIGGQNFTGTTQVRMEGPDGSGGTLNLVFAVNNDNNISATVPASLTPGVYQVRVVTPNGTSAATTNTTFTVLANLPPTVTNLNPSQGTNTSPVTVIITGTNFAGANVVRLGVQSVNFVVNNNTQITATVPAAVTPGIYDITVTTPGGTSATSSASKYTVLAGSPPSITTVTPNTGPNNQATPVTIGGSGFTGVTSGTIGSTPLTNIVVVSDNQVTANVPSGITPGTYNVSVTGPGGTSPSGPSSQFTVTAGAPAPSITNINPNNGPNTSTTPITITGTNFTGVTSGAIGSTPLQNVTVVNPTQVTATVPAGLSPATYNVSLTSPNGTSTNNPQSQFTVTSGTGGAPSVTSVTPNTGPNTQNTSIAIGGANLSNPTAVRIGNIPMSFTGVSSTQVNATVPSGIVPGTYEVTVTTSAGTSPAGPGTKFTVTSGGSGPDPTPPTAPDGITATKSGNNLTLGWVASTDNVGVDHYNIYRSTEANFAPTVSNRIGTSTTTQFTDTSVLADTNSYFYRVTAQDAAGNESQVSNMGFKRRVALTHHTNISNINWLSLPYRSPYTTANDIAQDIPNVTKVSRFNPDTQSFENWENFFGSFSGTNFTVRPGESYAVVINANSTANLVGWHDPNTVIAMTHHNNISNINNVSIPFHAKVAVANDIVNQVGPNVTKVTRFNPDTQQNESWEKFFGTFSGVNFTVTPGEGHVIIIDNNTQWRPDTF